MDKTKRIQRAGLLSAIAAFGLVFAGLVPSASAHPRDNREHDSGAHEGRLGVWVRVGPGNQWRYRYQNGRYSDLVAYDMNGNGRLEHNELDYRHFDRDRDGRLSGVERKDYWRHMVDMGYFGELNGREVQLLVQLTYLFDRNDDGRIIGQERVDFDRMIRSLRRFDEIDRNNDNYVSRREARMSHALTGRFYRLDRNGDGFVSRQEVRDDIIRAIRSGDRFWYDRMPYQQYGYGEHYSPYRPYR
jgi:hypothetical protein